MGESSRRWRREEEDEEFVHTHTHPSARIFAGLLKKRPRLRKREEGLTKVRVCWAMTAITGLRV